MLTFQDITFEKNNEKSLLVVTLYNLFSFEIPFKELNILGSWHIGKNSIEVKGLDEKKLRTKFMFLLDKYMKQLKNKLNGNQAIYIHQNAGIPLIGLQFIGIVDKGSEMIEIRPITNCNMNCIFCSVDEGPDSRKQVDFVVEKDYLVQELNKLLEFKYKNEKNKANIWINPSGEPFLYAPLADLVNDINAMPQVKEIHIITNGVLLNKPIIDELAKNSKVELNVSISGFSEEKGKQMMGSKAYDVNRVLEQVGYAAKNMKVTVTPVYVKGCNENEMKQLLIFCKQHNLNIKIQKFTTNKFGRNPIKEQSWEQFFEELKQLQEQTSVPLIQALGKIEKTNEYPKPFKKEDIIEVDIKAPGRMKNDKIGVAKQRAVLVLNCSKDKGKVKVRLVQSKHNLYLGIPL